MFYILKLPLKIITKFLLFTVIKIRHCYKIISGVSCIKITSHGKISVCVSADTISLRFVRIVCCKRAFISIAGHATSETLCHKTSFTRTSRANGISFLILFSRDVSLLKFKLLTNCSLLQLLLTTLSFDDLRHLLPVSCIIYVSSLTTLPSRVILHSRRVVLLSLSVDDRRAINLGCVLLLLWY